MSKKTVLFDMDGVILDSMSYHVRAWQEAMEEFGCWVPEKILYLHEGAVEPQTAVEIFDDHGCPMDADLFHAVLGRQKRIFTSRYQPWVKPYPEVPALLERLQRAGWEMALVTSSHREVLDRVLPKDIRGRMTHIVTGDQVTRRKPFPDPYLAAMAALERKPTSCLVVENAPAGIRAAKAAALHCVALTTTLAGEYLSDADAVVSSHSEMENYVQARLAPGP